MLPLSSATHATVQMDECPEGTGLGGNVADRAATSSFGKDGVATSGTVRCCDCSNCLVLVPFSYLTS